MKRKILLNLVLPLGMFFLFRGNLCHAQQDSEKDCNACAYLPLCKPDEVKRFAGKDYAGFNDANGNTIWYNCDKGIVTMKWLTSFTPVDYYVTQNSITNTKTETYYSGPTEYTMNTSVILNYNLPEGGSWSDGNRVWTIIKKGASYTFDGIKYPDVICVHYKETGQAALQQSQFYFYAKGKGLVKRLKGDTFDDTFMMMVSNEKKFVKEGKLKGTIDKFFVGKWSRQSSDGATVYYVEFFENGIGVMYNEPKRIIIGGGDMKDMSGRFITNGSESFFFWRIDNGLVLSTVSKYMNVKSVTNYKFTKNETNKTFQLEGVNPFIFLNKLQLPGSMWDHQAEVTQRIVPVTPFKGKIDNKYAGVWIAYISDDSTNNQTQKHTVVWTFNTDGTFQFKCSQVTKEIKDKYELKEFSGEWRVLNGSIELLPDGSGSINTYPLEETLTNSSRNIKLTAGKLRVGYQKFSN